MEQTTRDSLNGLRPAEIAVIGYILVTALINAFYYKTLGGTWSHFLARIGILGGMFLLITLHQNLKKPVWDFLRSFFPLATLGYFYGETDFYNNIWSGYLDAWFESFDYRLFGFQPSIEFSRVFHWPWFHELMSLAYISYFLMIFGVSWSIYRTNRKVFNRSLFLILQSFFFYYLIFILLPVQGPQFWFPSPLNSLPNSGVFHKMLRMIQSVGERPTGAFPSSHVGISVILCYLSYRYARPLFRWMAGITILLACSAVYLKAHYFADILGGLLSAPVMILLCSSLLELVSAKNLERMRAFRPAIIMLITRRPRS